MVVQVIDPSGDVVGTLLQNLLGKFFLIEDDNFLNRAQATLQVLAYGQNFTDHKGRAGETLQDAQPSALDSFSNIHFPFTGKQRRGTHLAQVESHRIAGRLRNCWVQVKFDILRFGSFYFQSRSRQARIGINVKTPRAKGGKQILCVRRRMRVVWNRVIYLVVRKLVLFSCDINWLLMSSIARRYAFSMRPAYGKASFVDLQKKVRKYKLNDAGIAYHCFQFSNLLRPIILKSRPVAPLNSCGVEQMRFCRASGLRSIMKTKNLYEFLPDSLSFGLPSF